jgi:hypothetical protein
MASSSVNNDENSDTEDMTSSRPCIVRRKKKVPRPCKFCGLHQTNLRRHLTLKHNTEPEVKHALSLPRLPQSQAFAKLRMSR